MPGQESPEPLHDSLSFHLQDWRYVPPYLPLLPPPATTTRLGTGVLAFAKQGLCKPPSQILFIGRVTGFHLPHHVSPMGNVFHFYQVQSPTSPRQGAIMGWRGMRFETEKMLLSE